jgi:hypothetical protein
MMRVRPTDCPILDRTGCELGLRLKSKQREDDMYSKPVRVTPKHGRPGSQRHGLRDRSSNVNLLPEQFFDTQISLATVCPETALMYAVLEDALLCFQEKFVVGMPHGQRRRAQEAEKWFFSDDRHSPYSFVVICDGLSLDAEDLRKKLKHLDSSQTRFIRDIQTVRELGRSKHRPRVRRELTRPRSYRAHRKEPL